MKRARRAAWIALGAAGTLAAALSIGEASGWPLLRAPLRAQFERAAGVPVALEGRFHLSLLGRPALELGHLRVAAAQGLALPHLVDGRDLRLAWRWHDLWQWRRQQAPLRLRELSARSLDAHLVRDAQGRASWRLGARPAPTDEAQADWPQVELLALRQGRLTIADAPLDTALEVRIAGRDGEAAADAGYRARIDGRWRALALALDVQTGGALPLLRNDGAPAPPLPLRVQGRAGAAELEFDGRAQALWGTRQLDGQLRLAGPSLAEVAAPLQITLPRTPPFELHTRLLHDAGQWQLQGARATIGRSRLGGDLRFDASRRPRLLSGTLTGARLVLADLAPAVGAPPRKAVQGKRAPTERVLPQRRFDLPALDRMDADLQVALDVLDLGTDALAPLERVRTRLKLQAGVLELGGLEAAAAGGRITGSTRLDSTRDAAVWSAELRLAGIRVERWLQGDARRYLSGVLGGELALRGAGRSSAQILGSLDGRSLLELRDGTLSHLATEVLGLDVAQALGVAVRGDKPLPLRCAIVDAQAQDGVLRLQRALLDNRDSTIHVGGRINLRDETLELAARSRPKDFSPLSLRTPITLTGRFAQPQLGIEGGRLAGRVVGALVLGAVVGPVAALLPLVDPGAGDAADPCAPAPRPAR